jgi:hypothetical protein
VIGEAIFEMEQDLKDAPGDFAIFCAGDDMLILYNFGSGVRYCSIDKSKFDSTVCKAHLLFERDFFSEFTDDLEVRATFNVDTKPVSIRFPFYTVRMSEPCRFSGSPHTSLGNSLLCGFVAAHVMDKIALMNDIKPLTDDEVAKQFTEEELKYNFVDKITISDHVSKCDYLSSKVIPIELDGELSYKLVPTFKCIAKLFWSISPILTPTTHFEFTFTIATACLSVFKGDPIATKLMNAVIGHIPLDRRNYVKSFLDDAVPWCVRSIVNGYSDQVADSELFDSFFYRRYGRHSTAVYSAIDDYAMASLIAPLYIPKLLIKVDTR